MTTGIPWQGTRNPSAAPAGFLFGDDDMTTNARRGFTTAILHSDRDATIEHGALHKPLHVSVAYGYRDARDLAAVFQGESSCMLVIPDCDSPRAKRTKAGCSLAGILNISASRSAICAEGRRSSSSSFWMVPAEHPTRPASPSRVRSRAFRFRRSQEPKDCVSIIAPGLESVCQSLSYFLYQIL